MAMAMNARERTEASSMTKIGPGVHLVRLWDTGMIRNVASVVAPVGLSARKRRPRIVSERTPCECQRHRQERKCVALGTRCFRTRRRSENWPAMLFR